MKRKIIEIDGLAYWANSLINHDSEGLDPADIQDIVDWLALNQVRMSDCLDAAFNGEFGYVAYGTRGISGDIATYTFEVRS